MAADDRTSQDAAVIGDDLVEALGFEPITSEVTEVAVLDDLGPEIEDLDEAVERIDDDIEIIDDPAVESDLSAFDSSTAEAEVLAVEEDELGLVDEQHLDDEPIDTLLDDDEPIDTLVDDVDLADVDLADADLVDADADTTSDNLTAEDETDEDGSLFGAPAPWPSASTGTLDIDDREVDTPEIDSSRTDDLRVDVADVDVVAEADDVDADDTDVGIDPVVFFNNGVDTDTAPLGDVDRDALGLDDDLAVDEQDREADDLLSTDDAAADGDRDLIDLDGQSLVADDEPDTADIADISDSAAADTEADADTGADLDTDDSIDLTDVDPLDAVDLDPTLDGDAVSLLEAPLEVPAPPTPDVGLAPPIVLDRQGHVEDESDATEIVAPAPAPALEAAPRKTKTRKKLRARKSRRVIRHIDPWSVLTFSVLFHLCFFAALLLASVLVWNAALAAGTIENIENFIRELGDYETFEINSDQVFRAAALIAGLLTLASSVLVVLLTVVFNLISDLIGGIRVTVIEEETVRIPTTAKK